MGGCAPVLLLAFNRPDQTRRVMEAIRAARPARLYVAADGARLDRDGEAERCDQVRQIATAIDWPCKLYTRFRDVNFGCAPAVVDAIDWFFQSESEGIILEDDCLPDSSFFSYCTHLLNLYREDTRIGQICGFNLLPLASPGGVDYFPSHFGWCWGWASWRRAWVGFDIQMSSWPRLVDRGLQRQHPFYPQRIELFSQIASGNSQDSCWDYQWHYLLASRGQLSLVPSVNLVQNIGFTLDATHTHAADSSRSQPASRILNPELMKHPEFLLPDPAYEEQLIREAHKKPPLSRFRSLVASLIRRLKSVSR
jgi:hypothetical protein